MTNRAKLFLLLVVLAFGMKVNAQEKITNDTTKWYIGAQIGAQVFFGKDDKEMSFGDRIAPVGEFTVGRWMNPWLALDATLSAAQFKGISLSGEEATEHFTTKDHYIKDGVDGKLRYQKGCYMQLRADAKFDMNTIIYGYKAERKNHILPYVGIGTASGLGSGNFHCVLALDAGIQYRYAINPQWAILADFNNGWFGTKLDTDNCPDNHKFHYACGLKLGFVYTFKH